MRRIGIMQITDSLAAGGLERVAVNLANALPQECYVSHLCATRCAGSLEANVESHVKKLFLQRHGRIDLPALIRFIRYIREHEIKLLHAHGTSLFVAALAKQFLKGVRLVWHDHFGRFETEDRSGVYRFAARAVDTVISVSEPLAAWARETLRAKDVRYIANFVSVPAVTRPHASVDFPGEDGFRIVCLANLRPQKDHTTLLKAVAMVIADEPRTHLLLAGGSGDSKYKREVEQCISGLGLTNHVTYLGSQSDVFELLNICDIGVLSSRSEGLPLALLEYGAAGLPAVVTNVGQCSEVVDQGRAGRLVEPNNPQALASELLRLLRAPEERAELGRTLHNRVEQVYGAEAAIQKVSAVYSDLLNGEGSGI